MNIKILVFCFAVFGFISCSKDIDIQELTKKDETTGQIKMCHRHRPIPLFALL